MLSNQLEEEKNIKNELEIELKTYIEEKKHISNSYAELITECKLYKDQIEQYTIMENQHNYLLQQNQDYQTKYSSLYQSYKKIKSYTNDCNKRLKEIQNRDTEYINQINSILNLIINRITIRKWNNKKSTS